jgi:membrane associated rhomboid family serine protease
MLTYLIIGFTAVISYMSFNNRELFSKLQLNPYQVYHRKEWQRMVTHGFVHADWNHLIFNMLSLFFFGDYIEKLFVIEFGNPLWYIVFYITAIVISSLTTLFKHKDNHYYNSVGASGAVSAVIFAAVLINPEIRLMLMFIPIPIPGFVFLILFFAYSQYMSRRNRDNINHDAHMLGALFGLSIPILLNVDYLYNFFKQIFN